MSNIPGSAHLNLSVGGLVALGGAMGYVKKGSTPSLIAGLTFGGLLLGSGYLIANDKEYEGHGLATATSSIMALGMGYRFSQTAKFMPAGMVAVVGAACAAYNFKKYQEWAPASEAEKGE